MATSPTRTVTFLFTDIEGSTKLWEEHPEAMRMGLARHDALLRQAIERSQGHVFKTMGDAFDAVFSAPEDALAAAAAAQRAVADERWEVPGGLRVRIALHTGTAEERDGDYFGPTLNRAARLLEAAHGGQTLLFQTTYDLVRDALPSEVAVRDLGEHRLRDLARPEHVFQLVIPGLPTDFPPLRSLENFPHNLPLQLTTFVGREREIAEVRRLLRERRMLTLTGPGGAGKTRLALQVGADLSEEFPDGAWLVELASLTDPALVMQTVATVLRVREEISRGALPETLADFLRAKTLLLVLDNCEHLTTACAQAAELLLQKCPKIRLLATSQEALGASGEATYPLPPLSLPTVPHPDAPGDLLRYEAVRLFVDRAVLGKPGFTVTPENARAVVQVVQRLDGIPLAIELAAARTRMMSVEQIAARLDDRFRLLTAGGRTAAPRHQTLKATMDWSYDLLSEPERALLCRLTVFAGGWTLEAAEAVCAGDGIEETAILDLLGRLVDRSLVIFQEGPDGGTRYRLLETVRQYGRDRLREAGEEEQVRRRHRDWFLQLAAEAEARLQGPQQQPWLDRIEVEHDNLRSALEWCRTAGENQHELRLAAALWRFWEIRGYWTEGRAWLEGALARTPEVQTSDRVSALNGAAYLAFFQGDFARAQALAEESLALSRRLGDTRGTASCLNILGYEACRLERFDRAAALGEESLALSQQAGDRWGVAGARSVLGLVARGRGNYERASTLLEESVALFRQLGDKVGTAFALSSLGLVARERGDFARATAILEETLAQFRELGDRWGVAFSLSNLGIVAWNQGDHERAGVLHRESIGLRRDLGDRRGIATNLIGLGVAAAPREPERAAILLAASESLREAIGVPPPPFIREEYDRYVGMTRAALGEAGFAAAWTRGRDMTLEEATELALEGRPSRGETV